MYYKWNTLIFSYIEIIHGERNGFFLLKQLLYTKYGKLETKIEFNESTDGDFHALLVSTNAIEQKF